MVIGMRKNNPWLRSFTLRLRSFLVGHRYRAKRSSSENNDIKKRIREYSKMASLLIQQHLNTAWHDQAAVTPSCSSTSSASKSSTNTTVLTSFLRHHLAEARNANLKISTAQELQEGAFNVLPPLPTHDRDHHEQVLVTQGKTRANISTPTSRAISRSTAFAAEAGGANNKGGKNGVPKERSREIFSTATRAFGIAVLGFLGSVGEYLSAYIGYAIDIEMPAEEEKQEAEKAKKAKKHGASRVVVGNVNPAPESPIQRH
ncbi:unnamed protein product [Amoebophrya sp. A25]|nr:unnamed protein product [Amoebophrya sp. A25]|eukprot:GSA25T00006465001.1